MKIVHICLACFYPDNHSYQENMLPKFHKQLGYEVEVIASLESFNKDGQAIYLEKGSSYQNEYDIKVTRLDYKTPVNFAKKMKHYISTYEALKKAKPDIIFIHGCQFIDMDVIVKYVKLHPEIEVYVDNHADFSNSGTNWLSKNILHKLFWKRTAKMIEPYTTKFYGVLPARVDWLTDMYNLPKEKCELLVMGADDDKVMEASDSMVRKEIRKKYDIAADDFLIVTGGKIDSSKTQTLLLMEAVSQIKNRKVKLIIFGSVALELKDKVQERCKDNKIQYIGWIEASDSYKYFASADLVVFPGRHSVFWEQVAGQGIPMLCKYWEGTTHVDLGGNVEFLKEDSIDEIKEKIESLIDNPERYQEMRRVALEKGITTFSYRKIAQCSIKKGKYDSCDYSCSQ